MTRPTRDCRCLRVRHEHGTRAAYVIDRCRCFACRVAYANSARVYRHGGNWSDDRLTDSTGTRRRLQALAAIGVSLTVIGRHMGVTSDAVGKLRNAAGRVNVDSAARVQAAYDQLWDKPCDTRHGRNARTLATRQGWAPPLAWDDDTIDNPDARPNTPGRGGWDLAPCGTPAAARRHYRRREPLDAACRAANKRATAKSRAAA